MTFLIKALNLHLKIVYNLKYFQLRMPMYFFNEANLPSFIFAANTADFSNNNCTF